VLAHLLVVSPPWVLQGLVALAAVPTQQLLTQAALAAFPAAVQAAVEHQSRLALLPLAVLVVLAL